MAKMYGLARLGRDAELRSTPNGEQVAGLSLAFEYGRKNNDGKKPVQWVEGALWGKRAESLTPHLQRGQKVMVTLDEVHIETFNKNDGTQGVKLAGKVVDIEFAGSPQQSQAPASAPRPAPRPAPAPRAPAPAGSGFDDLDDDIPW